MKAMYSPCDNVQRKPSTPACLAEIFHLSHEQWDKLLIELQSYSFAKYLSTKVLKYFLST